MKTSRHFLIATSGWITANILLFSCGVKDVNGDDVSVDQYLGCFYGNGTQWSDETISSSLVTTEFGFGECLRRCRHDFYTETYARFENGTTCKCGNNSGIQLQDSVCNSKCLGDFSQFCGGEFQGRFSAYVLYSVCPIGLYGPQCDKVCHCRHQIPCNRKTGKCPNECDGNYTGDQCDRRVSISEQYIGCFKDNWARALPYQTDMWEDSTLDSCLDICFGNYSYAGASYSAQCFCGELYARYGPLPESDCNTKCIKNRNQTCGGTWANSVYHYIDECSEIPDVCGPFSLSCINTNGGFKCECQHGSFVTDSFCQPAAITNNQALRTGLIVGGVLSGIILLITITFAALKFRLFRSNQNPSYSTDSTLRRSEDTTGMQAYPVFNPSPDSQEAEYVGLGDRTENDNRIYPGIKTHPDCNPNSRSEEEEYAGLVNRTTDDSRVYAALVSEDYENVAQTLSPPT